jgi:hypothetical protein
MSTWVARRQGPKGSKTRTACASPSFIIHGTYYSLRLAVNRRTSEKLIILCNAQRHNTLHYYISHFYVYKEQCTMLGK